MCTATCTCSEVLNPVSVILKSDSKSQVGLPVFFKLSTRKFECSIYTSIMGCSISSYAHIYA